MNRLNRNFGCHQRASIAGKNSVIEKPIKAQNKLQVKER